MIDPSAYYVDADELLALCLCEASFVHASPAAVKAGAVYCPRCAPSSSTTSPPARARGGRR